MVRFKPFDYFALYSGQNIREKKLYHAYSFIYIGASLTKKMRLKNSPKVSTC